MASRLASSKCYLDPSPDNPGNRCDSGGSSSLLFCVCLAQFLFSGGGRDSGQCDRVFHPNPNGGLRRQFHFLALAFHDVGSGTEH
jgi:hypothetical protein